MPSFVPEGSVETLSGRPAVSGGMSSSTQCTHVSFGAAGSGASGSSTISTRLFASSGTSANVNGGERSLPSQVYFAGISPPSLNTEDVICMAQLLEKLQARRQRQTAGHLLHLGLQRRVELAFGIAGRGDNEILEDLRLVRLDEARIDADLLHVALAR